MPAQVHPINSTTELNNYLKIESVGCYCYKILFGIPAWIVRSKFTREILFQPARSIFFLNLI